MSYIPLYIVAFGGMFFILGKIAVNMVDEHKTHMKRCPREGKRGRCNCGGF